MIKKYHKLCLKRAKANKLLQYTMIVTPMTVDEIKRRYW